MRSALGAVDYLADIGWADSPRGVVKVRSADTGELFVVKATTPTDGHFERELDAHLVMSGSLGGGAQTLRFHDATARVAIFDFLPGVLVEGTDAEFSEDVHRSAGALLAQLHDVDLRADDPYPLRMRARTREWLDENAVLSQERVADVREILSTLPFETCSTVPTHGDWQPRNWLIDGQHVSMIDFGRFAYRPPLTDFVRMQAQQWREHPGLADAFCEGYGSDPRTDQWWRWELLCQAVSTAVWADKVGATDFSHQGVRMLEDALELF